MKRIIYLFYNYYNSGSTKEIAYSSALFAILGLFMINIWGVLVLLGYDHWIFDYLPNVKYKLYIFFFLYVIIGQLALSIVYKKNEIVVYKYKGHLKRDGWLLFLYLVASFAFFLFIVAEKHGLKR
jgi:hypothetical protein